MPRLNERCFVPFSERSSGFNMVLPKVHGSSMNWRPLLSLLERQRSTNYWFIHHSRAHKNCATWRTLGFNARPIVCCTINALLRTVLCIFCPRRIQNAQRLFLIDEYYRSLLELTETWNAWRSSQKLWSFYMRFQKDIFLQNPNWMFEPRKWIYLFSFHLALRNARIGFSLQVSQNTLEI